MINRQVVLAAHPRGVPLAEDFSLVEAAAPKAGPGQMVVRNLYLSLEAAIRSWLDGTANYFEPIAEHPKRLRKHQRRQTRRQNLRCCAVAFSKPRQKFRIFKILTRIKGHHLS
mgnify:CR=1 FL=1